MREYESKIGRYGTANVTYFDGIGEAVALLRKNGWQGGNGYDWNGNCNGPQACDKALRGANDSETVEARRLFDKIDAGFRDRETHSWEADVTGAYPVVPEYLQGMPDCMRRRMPVESDVAPIRLFVETLVSAGVELDALRRRGAALAALAMRLSESRPVELYACWAGETHNSAAEGRHTQQIGAIRIGTSPVSVAEVVFLTSDPAMYRQITFGLACQGADPKEKHSSINWGCGYPNAKADDPRNKLIRDALQMNPQDVFLPGGFLDDNEGMLTDPVGWVGRFLEKQRTVE